MRIYKYIHISYTDENPINVHPQALNRALAHYPPLRERAANAGMFFFHATWANGRYDLYTVQIVEQIFESAETNKKTMI